MKKETIEFILELRRRLLHYLFLLACTAIIATFFANKIYQFLTIPIVRQLVSEPGLIATTIPAPFLIPFQSALLFSVFITMPYFLYQLWAFIVPALYQHERKFVWIILVLSSLLFYLGVIFAYLIVLPLVFKFFIYVAPVGVEVKPDISQYYHFIVRLFFAFGFCFEVPVAIILLVWSGLVDVNTLAKKRPFIIVSAFIIGMLLTPPDIVSQLLLAIPIWLLYELGLSIARYKQKILKTMPEEKQ